MFGTKMTDEFFARAHRRRRRVPQRRAEGAARRGRRSTASSSASTPTASTSCSPSSSASRSTTSSGSRARPRADMERFARHVRRRAESAVLVWSMGITQHEHGADNVAAIVNLGLARGNVGRPGAGLMPIRGHSGVQGGAEMGAYATAFPGGVADRRRAAPRALAERVRLPGRRPARASPPRRWSRPAARGELDVLYSSRRQLPRGAARPRRASTPRSAACRCACTRTSSCRARCSSNPGEVVVLLPAATRYEQRGGGTETTTERRIAFSPEIPGPRVGRGAQRVGDLRRPRRPRATRTAPTCVAFAIGPGDPRRDRARRARRTRASSACATTGDAVQWGGTRLCDGGDVPDARRQGALLAGRARRASTCPTGSFVLSTRRGKQFNSMVHAAERPAHRRASRRAVHGAADVDALGLARRRRVVVRSEHGEMRARVHASPLRPGNVQVFFPEGNVLLRAGRRDPASGVPDYNAVVTVEAAPR